MKNFAPKLLLTTAMMLTSHGEATEDIALQSNAGVFDKCKSLDFQDLFTPTSIQKINSVSENCISLTKLDLYNFNTNNVHMMCYTFENCKPLTKIKILTPVKTEEEVKNIFGIVDNLENKEENEESKILKSKPLREVEEGLIASFVCKFKVCCVTATYEIECTAFAPLTDMSCFYRNNTSILEAYFNKIDTQSFTKYVTNMQGMFFGCQRLKKIDLSNVDTRSVTNMDNMFRGCINLKEINVSGFDTSNVKSMKGMFAYCQSLEQLDISNFNMSNVKSCDYIFVGCDELNVLYLPAAEQPVSRFKSRDFSGCETLTRIIYK
ncbi:MAG: BspA family leucine-rich repeat surface protein [Alphaproteobacteria bacterium]|nr:BspA family leucine-rich repeat surface protein [Alphaproteobacteria bacterium]